MSDPASITQLLVDWSHGSRTALDQLTPIVYRELHELARRYLLKNRDNVMLQPTAVISELYLRLVDQAQPVQWKARSHFFGIAARLMRHILIDYYRANRAEKRGGDAVPVTLNETVALTPGAVPPDILDLDDALNGLARFDPRKADIIDLRYFGGMTREEIATALSLTLSVVKRDLALGEAWLRRQLTDRV